MAQELIYGYKKITIENWLMPDDLWPTFFRISSTGWLETNLGIILGETVPLEIRKLFEVARGALIYGYLFYPLCSLAEAQLYRVLEAAVIHKCKIMKSPKSLERFQQRVYWLIDKGVIPKQDKDWWDAVRDMRNITSHPENQMIYPPAGSLTFFRDKLQALFESQGMSEA